MENQHRKISGYRELSAEEIDKMNQLKHLGVLIGNVIEDLENDLTTDKRWLEIGKTDVQKGLMALIRSVAQPTTF